MTPKRVAARILGVCTDLILSRPLCSDQATYFYETCRGGMAVIVGDDGGYLVAQSLVPFDDHLAAYRSGRRTDAVVPA